MDEENEKKKKRIIKRSTTRIDEYPTVPIVVDSIKTTDGFNMTRGIYFSVENDDFQEGWELSIAENDLPFIMYLLSGIIVSPFGKQSFTDPKDIDNLYEVIEGKSNLSIETNYVWIPNNLFCRNHKRGSVYRVHWKLFYKALSYQNNTTDLDDFEYYCGIIENPVMYCSVETKIFSEWNKQQINNARKYYHSNEDKQLRIRNGKPLE